MIFCVKCGKEIQEDFKICPYCGKEIALPTSADQPAPTAEQTEQTAVETAVQTAPAQTVTEPTAQTAVETPAPTAQTATAPMPTASAPAQTAPVYTAGQAPQFAPQYTAGVPQGYYQQNIPTGYAYPAQTATPAPVAVKKKTHPATVILLIFGLLCIAGAAVYTYFNRDMFVSKANAEEVLPCSFDVRAWFVGDVLSTSKYTVSIEDEQQMLDELNKYIQSEFPTKEVNLNSSVFVVPPIKLTLDADAGTEYPGAERLDLRGGRFTVILNKSLYDLETNYDMDNMQRFMIFSRDAEGDVEFDSVFAYYEYFDDNFESPVFAIIDGDALLSQLGFTPEEIAQMDE